MNKFAASLLVLGLLSGCMHEDEKEDPANTASLQGKWLGNTCTLADALYERLELNIENSNFTITNHRYTDSNCTTMDSMVTTTGTFKIGNTVTTPTGNTATEVDFTDSAANGGATELDIYAIINGQLYLGVDDDNNATRPTTLDMSFYFTKL